MEDWRQLVRQLYDCFDEDEARIQFLHDIDQNILDYSKDLKDIVSRVLQGIARFTRADAGYFYIVSGADLLLLSDTIDLGFPKLITISDTALLDQENESFYYGEAETQRVIPKLCEFCSTQILVTVALRGRVWGIMGLESKKPQMSTPFIDKDVRHFLTVARDQLAIALHNRTQYDENEQLSRLQNELFGKELDVFQSMHSLVKNIIAALPRTEPLRIEPPPDIQILFFEKGNDYLTINQTTGSEPLNTKVYVNGSISGLLVENPELPFYLCNPKDHPDRYKGYLQKPGKNIQTELVVSIRLDMKVIGVINLESEHLNAFKVQHIEAMVNLAEKIAIIVNALQQRMRKSQVQSQAGTFALNRFFTRLAKTYRHKMGDPIHKVNFRLNQIREVIESSNTIDDTTTSKIEEYLTKCLDLVDSIDQFHDRFSNDLPGFLTYGRYSINTLTRGALGDINPEALKEKYGIEIVFNPSEDFDIYCSLFFREHIFNILHNAAYSILDRMKLDTAHKGRIEIKISKEVDPLVSKLNKRCKIELEDNGMGFDKSQIGKLATPSFTTKESGTGYGLFAARQYLKSIGGRLEFDCDVMKFFRVAIWLDIYEPEVHDKLGAFSANGMEVE